MNYRSMIHSLHVLLDHDCSIRVYQSSVVIFQKYLYYAGIMLNASSDQL